MLFACKQQRHKAASASFVVLSHLAKEGERDRKRLMLRILQPFLEMFREALLQTGDQAVLGAEMIERSPPLLTSAK